MMEARLVSLFKSPEEYEVLEKYLGKQLKGRGYKPLFEYFGHLKKKGAFRVLNDTYVTEESGTGVVHQVKDYSDLSNECTSIFTEFSVKNLDQWFVNIFDQGKSFRLIDLIPSLLYEVKPGIKWINWNIFNCEKIFIGILKVVFPKEMENCTSMFIV